MPRLLFCITGRWEMTNAQIKATQDLCRPHRYSYEDIISKGAFATCQKGCGHEWGQTEEYKALQVAKST